MTESTKSPWQIKYDRFMSKVVMTDSSDYDVFSDFMEAMRNPLIARDARAILLTAHIALLKMEEEARCPRQKDGADPPMIAERSAVGGLVDPSGAAPDPGTGNRWE